MSTKDSLFRLAREAAKYAHSPYSKFQVGSALELENGRIFSGCNIENASYGATVCGERVAIWKALSENPGAKIKEIVVYTNQPEAWPPCGLCRQVIAEFATAKTEIHTANDSGIQKSYTLAQLLPAAFGPSFL